MTLSDLRRFFLQPARDDTTHEQPRLAAARVAFCLALTVALAGCDRVDIQPAGSSSESAERGADAASVADGLLATLREAKNNAANAIGDEETDSAATPSMASIGPDSAKRVYYQFLDDRGGVQFVERLDAVPAAWRERVGYVEMDRPPPLTPESARASWKLSATEKTDLAFRTNRMRSTKPNTPGKPGKRRMDDFQNGPVILYSATWCGYCTKARRHLDREGVEYEIRDVDNGGIARELKAKTGRGGVPVLDFEGEILRGYSAGQYDKVIRAIKG